VPRAQTMELNMTVDAALKYIVSMGVVTPEQVNNKKPNLELASVKS
jgi:uncharacterized membrane protein